MNTLIAQRFIVWLDVPRTLALLAVSVVMPYVIHLIPLYHAVPMGARLLPMFYAPLIAVMLRHLPSALIISICSPLLNHCVTGMPVRTQLFPLTLELVFFTLVVAGIRRYKHPWLSALTGFSLAKLISTVFMYKGDAVAYLNTIGTAWPGIIMLMVITLCVTQAEHR